MEKRVLLIGNPNVGKSALFTRLTGVRALSSNYPGTTVGFLEGDLDHEGQRWHMVDVPGAYTLDPTNEAEEVARRMLAEGADCAVIVLDATALERNLFLALQVLQSAIPCVAALNMVDEARHCGIEIDIDALSRELAIPVIPTVAITGEGLAELVSALSQAKVNAEVPHSGDERWARIGHIIGRVQRVIHRHHTLRDRLEDVSVNALWGGLMGLAVLGLTFWLVRFCGEGLINEVLDPLYNATMMPLLQWLSPILGPDTLAHKLVVGTLVNGAIDPEQSFGLISTGLYVALVMVFPYVLVFYAALSFLEDFGYLPRMAVVFDAIMHKLGLHGYAVIPTLLSFGCNVPGIMATRVLESARERFIAATLISVAVPCAGLQAMIIGAVSSLGWKYVFTVYGTLLALGLLIGWILNRFLSGYSPELITEIPPYRLPPMRDWVMKLWFRMKSFFAEAIPLVMIGILIINFLEYTGAMDALSQAVAPLFKRVLGLPVETAPAIMVGLLRKDIAMGMLIPLALGPKQLVIATVVLSVTFPCFATFAVLMRELGFKKMMASLVITLTAAFASGALLNLIL